MESREGEPSPHASQPTLSADTRTQTPVSGAPVPPARSFNEGQVAAGRFRIVRFIGQEIGRASCRERV